jgi:diacylglycerol kinase (ATP)
MMQQVPAKNTGWRRIVLAGGYSLQGLIATWRNEAAFRQELWLVLLAAPLALWLGDGLLEKALLIATLLLILVVELLNSALESIVDRIGPEHHTLSGRAKDQGSAAVLLTLILAAIVWAAILLS